MAPRRNTARGAAREPAKSKRVAAFLKEFDQEVKTRIDQIKVEGKRLVKEMDDMFNMEVLRLSATLREMNCLSYFAVGGSEQALDKAVSIDEDVLEITKLASEAIQTPLKVVRKAKKFKQAIETIGEETESTVLPVGKRSRQEGEAAGRAPEPGPATLQPHLEKAKMSTKKPVASKKSKPPSARSSRFSKSRSLHRSSRTNVVTPASQKAESSSLKFATPALTPKFDSRIFQTPGLRPPGAHERVFTISANGSPLANSSDIFITVPVGGGESIRVAASELSKGYLTRLNPDVLGSVKKLSSQLTQFCSSLNSHN